MYKFILAVAVFAVTACGSSAKTEETPAAGVSAESTTVVTDSTAVATPTTGEAAK